MTAMKRSRRDKNSELSMQCGKTTQNDVIRQNKSRKLMQCPRNLCSTGTTKECPWDRVKVEESNLWPLSMEEKLKDTLEQPPVSCPELAIHEGMLPVLWSADVKQVSRVGGSRKSWKILIPPATLFSLREWGSPGISSQLSFFTGPLSELWKWEHNEFFLLSPLEGESLCCQVCS